MRAFVIMSFECDSNEHAGAISRCIPDANGAIYAMEVYDNVVDASHIETIGKVLSKALSRALFPRKVA